jgi:hypothetical protein
MDDDARVPGSQHATVCGQMRGTHAHACRIRIRVRHRDPYSYPYMNPAMHIDRRLIEIQRP